MITKELVTQELLFSWHDQWEKSGISEASYKYIARLAAAYGAEQRDAELVATDMRCVAWQERQMFKDGWSDWYPSGARLADQPKERVLDQIVYQWRPVFSPEQLAAARLHGAREEPVNAGLAKLAHTQALRIKELEQASAVNKGLLDALKNIQIESICSYAHNTSSAAIAAAAEKESGE